MGSSGMKRKHEPKKSEAQIAEDERRVLSGPFKYVATVGAVVVLVLMAVLIYLAVR